MTERQIFDKDVEGVDWAEVVVANMDGPDPDSGTCWECGYAYRKKPIVVFRTDFRVGYEFRPDPPVENDEQAPYNLMLTESATIRLDLASSSIAEVASRINEALAALSGAGSTRARKACAFLTLDNAEIASMDNGLIETAGPGADCPVGFRRHRRGPIVGVGEPDDRVIVGRRRSWFERLENDATGGPRPST